MVSTHYDIFYLKFNQLTDEHTSTYSLDCMFPYPHTLSTSTNLSTWHPLIGYVENNHQLFNDLLHPFFTFVLIFNQPSTNSVGMSDHIHSSQRCFKLCVQCPLVNINYPISPSDPLSSNFQTFLDDFESSKGPILDNVAKPFQCLSRQS